MRWLDSRYTVHPYILKNFLRESLCLAKNRKENLDVLIIVFHALAFLKYFYKWAALELTWRAVCEYFLLVADTNLVCALHICNYNFNLTRHEQKYMFSIFLSLSLSVYIWIYIHMYIYIYISIHMYMYIHICACVSRVMHHFNWGVSPASWL